MSWLIVKILTLFLQMVFLTYSLMLILWGSLYRLVMKLLTKHTLPVNPFKHTHEDVFKTRRIYFYE
jgi:hypothetical protein